jgi:lipoprotein-releasing system permease protein
MPDSLKNSVLYGGMNLSMFIARRVASKGQQSFSRLIIRIAIAAVALSITVMILATSLIKGFKSEISSKMFGFWGHIHITSTQQTTTYAPQPIDARPVFLESLKRLKNIPTTEGGSSYGGVRHVQAFVQISGIIKTADNFEGIVIKGVGNDFDWSFIESNLVEGKRVTACDTCRDILISKTTADRLQLKTGSKFIVHFVQNNAQQQRLFQVSGIYKTGLEEYDKRFAIADMRLVQGLLGWDERQVAGFEVFITDLRDMKTFNEYIYSELIANDLTCQTIKEEQPAIFDWLDLQDVNEQVILSLMLVVGILNMVTALLILILERTNMIGTLKALGSTNRQIQTIFLYYGAIIVLWGLAIGNLIGLSLAWLEKTFKFVKLSEVDYYLSYAPIQFDFAWILFLNIGTFIITLLCLTLPTFLVTKISPVKAIHFK